MNRTSAVFLVSQPASSLLANSPIHRCGMPAVDDLMDGGLRGAQCLEIAGSPDSAKEALALEFVRSAVGEGVEVLVIGKSVPQPHTFSD